MSDKSAFDKLTVFDLIDLTAFDQVELPTEDKVIFSPELSKLIKEQIYKEIANIPIGKMVSLIMEKEIKRQNEESESLKKKINSEVSETKNEIKGTADSIKKELDEFTSKTREKYDALKNEIINQPKYQFGGFAPPSTVGHSGQFLTNDGAGNFSWIAGTSATGTSLFIGTGTPSVPINGDWQIIIDGSNLSFQRRESSAWVEKGVMMP